MDLKQFVSRALADVVQGVLEAQQSLGENGRHVNPELSTQQGPLEEQGKVVSIRGQAVQNLEFDVAVTAKEATGTEGKISVLFGAVTLGAGGQSSAENLAVSRIKFTVPITLPYGEKMGA